jgi:response regulator RpfG family c-di-GMP phosphodiesterase
VQTALRPNVLVVDDEKFIRDVLADFLSMEGYTVRTAEDGVAALEELSRAHFDLVLSDLKMPRMGGLELLARMEETAPSTITVIMTGFGTVESAIDAMKRGAYDYVLKPFKVEEVLHVVQRGLDKQRLAAENLRLREAISLYSVSEAIRTSLSIDDVVQALMDTSLRQVQADRAEVWLHDGDGVPALRAARFAGTTTSRPDGLLASAGERQETLQRESLTDALTDEAFGKFDYPLALRKLDASSSLLVSGAACSAFFGHVSEEVAPTSLLIVSINGKERKFGLLVVAYYSRSRRLEEGQRKLLAMVADRAGAALENAKLFGDLQESFQQTIQGLAKAIDKMDAYTAGHSERVAFYSVYLARRLGMSVSSVEVVRQSALMHDIGKIGCVMNLNKPGKLTTDEYEAFKQHSVFGRDILEPIKFLHPLIPGVHLHHERFDGRGYPLGLKGHDIPEIARIISIADTYDAMTSNRAYRKALPHEVAVDEIERCKTTQFDPEFADAFRSGIDELREQEQADGNTVPE